MRQLLAVLERELGERDFLCGELSLGDFAAICYVPGTKAMGLEPGEFPGLLDWMERMRRIPVVSADHEPASFARVR